MKRPRDSFRLRVYAAEQAYMAEGGRGLRFGAHGDHQGYVDRLCGRLEVYPVQVVWSPKLKGLRAYCEPVNRRIVVPTNKTGAWTRCELVTLHEMAHIVQPPLTAYHGDEFLKIYLDLVELQLGVTSRDRLLRKMMRARIPLPPPYCN